MALALCLALTSCGKSGPTLMNIGQKTPVQYGDVVQVSCGVKNSGAPFKGLKITLSGDAVQKDLVRAPSSLPIELWDMSATPQKKATATFVAAKEHSWVAELPELDVDQPTIAFALSMPASASGSGILTVSVQALDDTGTAAVFSYPCQVDSMQVALAREERVKADLERIRTIASPPPTLENLTSPKLKIDPDFELRMQAERSRALEIQNRRALGR